MKNYLNNKVTGDSIVVTKIEILSNSIEYSILNASGITLSSKLPYRFNTIKLSDSIEEAVILRDVIFNTLKTELSLVNYVVEPDKQNWLSPNKSMRFIASRDNVTKGFKDQNGLATILNNVLTDAIVDTELVNITDSKNEIFYANSITEENIDVNAYLRYITDETGTIIYSNESGIIDIEYKLV